MGKGSGGGKNTTSTQASVPPELSGLYTQTGKNVQGIQDAAPLNQFIDPNPTKVAPLSGTQTSSLDLLNRNLNDARTTPLEDSAIAQAGQRYYEKNIAPGIINQATLAGLGRSTSLTNALAAASAQTALPLLQGEQARRDQLINQGFQGGDVERGVQQAGFNSEAADALRRQGIAEQALFGPLGQLPSTFGQTGVSKSSSGGGGWSVICTELHRQGIMSDQLYSADSIYGMRLPAHVMAGYHVWGISVARVMRRSKWLTRAIAPIALPLARSMEDSIMARQGSKFWSFALKVGIAICGAIGRGLCRKA